MKTVRLMLTCEHGGNEVPHAWQHVLCGHEALLASHRGWDAGTAALAQSLSRTLKAPLIASTVSRLVVDLNRSADNPAVFARETTRPLSQTDRQLLLRRLHAPHWNRVRRLVRRLASQGMVLHVGVHSFTPALDGQVRKVDIGLLYDPARPGEDSLCRCWQRALKGHLPAARIYRNQPYRGWTDGLVTALRREWPAERYVGVELEINQRLLEVDRFPDAIATALTVTLQEETG